MGKHLLPSIPLKMKFYIYHPHVAGELVSGDRNDGTPHYEINIWPCDDFIQAHPIYAISDKLKDDMPYLFFSSLTLTPCKVTFGNYYIDGLSRLPPPTYWEVKIKGTAMIDNFGVSPRGDLIVSENARNWLQTAKLTYGIFENIDNNKPSISNLIKLKTQFPRKS